MLTLLDLLYATQGQGSRNSHWLPSTNWRPPSAAVLPCATAGAPERRSRAGRVRRQPRRFRLVPLIARLLVAVMVLLSLGGCDTLRSMMPSARKAEAAKATYRDQQSRNMRFADDYAGRLIAAAIAARPTLVDAQQRELISGWMLDQVNAAYVAATGDNPTIATLDLLTLATLSRMVLERTFVPRYPKQTAALLQAHRVLEAQAWALGKSYLSEEQQRSLHALFAEWLKRNPDYNNVAFVRFQDFVGDATSQGAPTDPTRSGGLFAFVGLDPLAGLDPAVEQVELSRLLAERATYYMQRLPVLVDLQLERSLSRVAAGPDLQKLQQQAASMTQSVERFAVLAQGLPQLLTSEREALVRQVSTALVDQQATLQPMLIELRGTLQAGDAMAGAVDQAVQAIDALMVRFSNKPGSAPDKPFDISEYTRAAQAITAASTRLHALVETVAGSVPQLDQAVDTAADAGLRKGQTLVDHLFERLAALIGLLLVAALIVVWAHHLLAKRRDAASARATPPV